MGIEATAAIAMHGIKDWIGAGLATVLVLTGCGGETGGESPGQAAAGVEQSAPGGAPAISATQGVQPTEQELRNVRTEILERVDSVDDALGTIPMLTAQERRELRRDLNAEQIARARALGVRAADSSRIEQLRRAGRLVPLEDSTRHWVLRKLEYSAPYVTPDTRAMLTDVGRRFHARLDSLGLPPYRMEITSVLRTPETQADLRKSNPNASREVSAHEFGTTLDIARAHFSAPAPPELRKVIPSASAAPPALQQTAAAALDSVAEKHSSALQAALGRVLVDMRKEGNLLVMMERRQAVYHITLARRFRS